MVGFTSSRAAIGLEGAQHSLLVHYQFNHSNAPCSRNDLWGLFVYQPFIITTHRAGATDQRAHILTSHPGTGGKDKQADNMAQHAWNSSYRLFPSMNAHHGPVSERVNEETGLEQWLAAAETCGVDATLHHSLQALTERQRRGWDEKNDSALFISVPPTALYPTLDLDESCYGVKWTWGGRRQTDRLTEGREGDMGWMLLHRAEVDLSNAACWMNTGRAEGRDCVTVTPGWTNAQPSCVWCSRLLQDKMAQMMTFLKNWRDKYHTNIYVIIQTKHHTI